MTHRYTFLTKLIETVETTLIPLRRLLGLCVHDWRPQKNRTFHKGSDREITLHTEKCWHCNTYRYYRMD